MKAILSRVLVLVGFGLLCSFGEANAAGAADPNIVVTLRGIGVPVVVDIPGVPTPGICLGTDLFDTKTDRPSEPESIVLML